MNSMSGEKLKGIPYTGTLPATLTGTKAGYLHKYKIYGNLTQNGTPTPENPIYPSECGERTGNLFDKNAMVVPAYLDSQYGTYRLSSGNSKSALIRCLPNTDYSFTAFSRTFRVSFFDHKPADNDSPLSRYIYDFSIYGTHSRTVSSPSSAQYAVLFFYNSSVEALDYTVDYISSTIMIVEGSTAPSSYIPFGYKLPLLSGSTPVDIYLGESQTTRRIKKLVLTGEETWQTSTAGASTRIFTVLSNCMSLSPAVCTDFKYNSAIVGYPRVNEFVINSTSSLIFGISLDDFADLNAWKAFLAQQYANGTPVTVWYVLAEPETAVINEPLRKIGDYADTIDSTQTTAQIPTSANSTTISWGGQGLTPSQFDSIQEWVDIPTYTRVNGEWVADT